MELIRKFTDEQYQGALESWGWLPIADKKPFLANMFGDVFLEADDGVYFLDAVNGALDRVCESKEALQEVLNTREGQDQFLWLEAVVALDGRGVKLAETEVYDFEIAPVLGGEVDLPNIKPCDFEVALNLAGQIHEQVKDLPPGTKISEVTFDI